MKKVLTFIIVILAVFVSCKEQATEQTQAAAPAGNDEVLASTGDTIEWSMFTPFGPNDSGCSVLWPQLFDEVYTRTGGQLKISIFWTGQHPYEGSDALKIVKDGIAQLSHLSSGYLTSVEPVLGADSIPMLFPEDSMDMYFATASLWSNFSMDKSGVLDKALQERWNAGMIHGMPASYIRLFTKGYSADTPGSLAGHKIRVFSPETAEFVTLMGGTPVTLSGGEVYTALSTNLIDGVVTGLQYADSGGFLDICDTINLWEMSAMMDGLVVNLDALNQLPDDVRRVFLDVMQSSAMKPEMYELNVDARVLERQIKSGKAVSIPASGARQELLEQIRTNIINPWLETTGEEGAAVIQQIQSYMDSK